METILQRGISKTVDSKIPFKAVHASRGKAIRAEPISALYEQGKVRHFGHSDSLKTRCVNGFQESRSHRIE